MRFCKKLPVFVVLCSLCLSCSIPAFAAGTGEAEPEMDAEAAIVTDAYTGAVIYGKNIDKQEYPASITKILTALVALENCSLDETVAFSHNAVFSIEPGSTHIGMREGEELSMEDCLYALLMASANEVANAIAEHVGGSVEAFANMMNKRAAELGCTGSHFVNPNGLHDDDHYTTARDMALITQAALRHEEFRTIIATYSYVIPATNLVNEERPIQNHHQMLPQRKYPYDGCIGGKTGYTSRAKHTLVTCAERDGRTIICVELSSEAYCYDSTASLLDYGFAHFGEAVTSEVLSEHTSSFDGLLKKAGVSVAASSASAGNGAEKPAEKGHPFLIITFFLMLILLLLAVFICIKYNKKR